MFIDGTANTGYRVGAPLISFGVDIDPSCVVYAATLVRSTPAEVVPCAKLADSAWMTGLAEVGLFGVKLTYNALIGQLVANDTKLSRDTLVQLLPFLVRLNRQQV